MRPIDIPLLRGDLPAMALRDLPAAAVILDAEQRIVFVNAAFEALTDYRAGELLGKPWPVVRGEDTETAVVAGLGRALREGRAYRGRVRDHRKDGTAFQSLLRLTPLGGSDSTATHFVGLLLETAPSTGQGSETDGLTGLVTRTALQRRLAAALALQRPEPVGVVHCGVNRFAWINSGVGPAGGDEALRRIADILRSASPSQAVVGRASGDEFVVVLPALNDPGDVGRFVAELEERFRAALPVQGRDIHVTISIGSAVAARTGATGSSEAAADRLLREADSAMYRVKHGRGGQGIDGSGADLLQLDAELHDAVDRGELVAYFQPQYDARTGELTGWEALARWHHPRHGTLLPDRFIPLAEADGLISRLGDQILQQACRFANRVAGRRPLQMQVNVSAQQLLVPGLADRIRGVLAEHPDRAWSLGIEVTESSLIVNHDLVRTELEQLRDLGVGVSIDDFGSGYSSLSQLRDLPATELKIDRSFVHREDAVGVSLLTAIIGLAHSLDLTVVAEGVETRTQLATLRDLSCDRLQGRHLCPPLSAEDAVAARSDIAALLTASA